MSKFCDLKVERDIARATAVRLVKKAAAHLSAALDPRFDEEEKGEERAKAADAENQAKKWAAKADLLSGKLSSFATREIDPTA
jgi:hypothetical protein